MTPRMRNMWSLYLLSGEDSAPPCSYHYFYLGVSVHKGQIPAAQPGAHLSPASKQSSMRRRKKRRRGGGKEAAKEEKKGEEEMEMERMTTGGKGTVQENICNYLNYFPL